MDIARHNSLMRALGTLCATLCNLHNYTLASVPIDPPKGSKSWTPDHFVSMPKRKKSADEIFNAFDRLAVDKPTTT